MHLSLEVYALETSNGDVAITSVPFDVTVAGVADRVNIDPQAVAMNEGDTAMLDLRVVLEDHTITPENVEITFTAVPPGSIFSASAGGLVEALGGGSWRFTGTEAQAAAIGFAPSPAFERRLHDLHRSGRARWRQPRNAGFGFATGFGGGGGRSTGLEREPGGRSGGYADPAEHLRIVPRH